MTLNQIAEVEFPTSWATFRLLGFQAPAPETRTEAKYPESALALVLGDVKRSSPIVRIHSQCITGEVFHSLRCDCRDQMHFALSRIAREGAGVLVYEFQEGRGIGLMEKLRAYELQDGGLDTVDANSQLGHPVDMRNYTLAVEVLRFLGIRSLRLISNNPEKIHAVQASGIQITDRIDAAVQVNPHCERYLTTKRERLGHISVASANPSPPHGCRNLVKTRARTRAELLRTAAEPGSAY